MATIIRTPVKANESHHVRESFNEVAALAESARQCLEQARSESTAMLEEARLEAARLRREAIEEGKRLGREEATQELRSQLDRQLADAPVTRDQIVAELRRAQDEWFSRWEQDVLHLACAIAARLVRRECVANPQLSIGLIREALELSASRQRVRLLLHPSDLELLGDEIGRLLSSLGRREAVEIVGDPTIETGSCRVVTEHGEIDQQWTAQLARICDELSTAW